MSSQESAPRRSRSWLRSFLMPPFSVLLGAGLPGSATAGDGRIAASSQILWVQSDGTVMASGDAESSRGDSGERPRNHFEVVEGLSGIVAVANHLDAWGSAAALDEDGRVFVWGDVWCPRVHPMDECGSRAHVPGPLSELSDVTAIALGRHHLVALGADGRVRTLAGDGSQNEFGELGTKGMTAKVVEVSGIDDAVAVAAGGDVTLVLRSDGTVWGVGCGDFGLLGSSARQAKSLIDLAMDETIDRSNPAPVRIEGLEDIQAIAVGARFAVALDRKGRVWGWGINDSGQLGGVFVDDLVAQRPHRIAGLDSIVRIAAGYDFTLALGSDGRVRALGGNVYGTLGDLRGELEGELRIVEGLESVEEIYAGHYNGFARLSDGRFVGWGANGPSVGGFHPRLEPGSVGPTELSAAERPAPPSAVVAAGGVSIVLGAELSDDHASERIELEVGEERVATLEVDAERTEQIVRFDLPPGVHPYRIVGEARYRGGTRPIRGEGLLVVDSESMATQLRRRTASSGLPAAIGAIQERLERARPGVTPPWARLHAEPPPPESELSRRSLPDSYQNALTAHGPFRLGGEGFPGVALYAPDPARTVRAWVDAGRTLEYGPDSDPFLEDTVWAFESYGDEVDGVLDDPRLSRAWIGAVHGQSPLIVLPSADPCPDGSPAAVWPDFFDVHVDHDSGEETLFTWLDFGECSPETTERLTQAVDDVLFAAYSEAGVVFLFPSDSGEPAWVGLSRQSEDERSVTLKLEGGNWME